MSRKDTIIIAVLVNAGLLIALFAMALKPDAKQSSPVVQAKPIEQEVVRVKPLQPVQPTALKEKEPAQVKPVPKAAVKPLPVPSKQSLQTVTVQSGDALEKIARRYKVGVKELMDLNGLKTAQLQVGQVLKIPTVKTALEKSKEPKYYVVQPGDSPWTIASKNKIQLSELLRLNQLDETKAKKIRPGDKLRIE